MPPHSRAPYARGRCTEMALEASQHSETNVKGDSTPLLQCSNHVVSDHRNVSTVPCTTYDIRHTKGCDNKIRKEVVGAVVKEGMLKQRILARIRGCVAHQCQQTVRGLSRWDGTKQTLGNSSVQTLMQTGGWTLMCLGCSYHRRFWHNGLLGLMWN